MDRSHDSVLHLSSAVSLFFFFFYLGHNKGVIYRGSEWISGRQEHDLTAGVDSKTTSHFVKLPLCQIVLTLFSIFPDFFFFFPQRSPTPPSDSPEGMHVQLHSRIRQEELLHEKKKKNLHPRLGFLLSVKGHCYSHT